MFNNQNTNFGGFKKLFCKYCVSVLQVTRNIIITKDENKIPQINNVMNEEIGEINIVNLDFLNIIKAKGLKWYGKKSVTGKKFIFGDFRKFN